MTRWQVQRPFMSKSKRELEQVWPKNSDVNEFIKSQRKGLRKVKDPEKRRKIKLIIEEFESIRDLL